jgi:hypothetical protein
MFLVDWVKLNSCYSAYWICICHHKRWLYKSGLLYLQEQAVADMNQRDRQTMHEQEERRVSNFQLCPRLAMDLVGFLCADSTDYWFFFFVPYMWCMNACGATFGVKDELKGTESICWCEAAYGLYINKCVYQLLSCCLFAGLDWWGGWLVAHTCYIF